LPSGPDNARFRRFVFSFAAELAFKFAYARSRFGRLDSVSLYERCVTSSKRSWSHPIQPCHDFGFFGGSANAAVAARIPVISYLLDRYNVSRGGNIIRFCNYSSAERDLVVEEPFLSECSRALSALSARTRASTKIVGYIAFFCHRVAMIIRFSSF
jgi:hypothetical protein